MFKQKKILITGGLGFVGSNIASKCLELESPQVTILDNLDPNGGGNFSNIVDFRNQVKFEYGDMLDFDSLAKIVIDKDIIFNCAASTSHPLSMRQPWLDLDANVRGTMNLLEAIKRFNPKVRLVHLGTSSQIGRLVGEVADENHPEYPLDIYSANKSVSEKYVIIYAKSFGLRATVIRLSNTFGPRASIHSPEFTFNNYFIGLALQNKEIRIFGDGKQKRNVIFIADAVDAIIDVVLNDLTVGSVYFAVSNEHYSVAEIANMTVQCIGRGQVVHVPWPQDRKSTEIGDSILSNSKLTCDTKWRPKITLKDGLKLTANYFNPRLNDYIR